jgi:DNA-binding GntR family transcriptional regulator
MTRAPRASSLQAKLAAHIVDFARRNGLATGHHFSEAGLARQLGVSRSPVRGALRLLMDRGVVRALPNRGFRLARTGARLRVESLAIPVTDDDRLYMRIADDRVNGRLHRQFTESDLMRRYRVSRSLLARVLLRLNHDGIVKRARGHGWLFLPIIDSERAREASYRYRMVVEPAMLLEPGFKLDPAQVAVCRANHRRMMGERKPPNVELFETNAAFHEMLAAFSGNRFFVEAVQQQNRLRRLSECKDPWRPERVIESCREHLAVLDALESGERQWAATLLKRHLEIASRLKLGLKDDDEAGRPGESWVVAGQAPLDRRQEKDPGYRLKLGGGSG